MGTVCCARFFEFRVSFYTQRDGVVSNRHSSTWIHHHFNTVSIVVFIKEIESTKKTGDILPQKKRKKKMTSSLKGILLQYGGFLVAMLAVAITVVSPRSEALFGISTTTCLLIGASSSLFLFSLFLLLSN